MAPFKVAPLDEYKVFCDPVHGHISLHPLLVKIIDTPQFQRLRQIKQLGSKYFVYPGASHNRFEHSIGTAYLAGKLARIIKENQPELGVDDRDVLCVEMAGLCHDLGHGPFSHTFDGVYMKRARPDKNWEHETGSCDMFDHLIEAKEVQKSLKKYKIRKKDKTFVKEMIAGPLKRKSETKDQAAWFPDSSGRPYTGRGKENSFLYDIVSNKESGVDVDKWDYFARDCHNLGIQNGFDHDRFMKFVKVLKVVDNEGEVNCKKRKVAKTEGDQESGRLRICARDKECENLYEMFHTRSMLHRKACQHRVSKVIDCMIADAMELAEPYVTIFGKEGARRKISECVDDPVAYTKLNDGILDLIVHLAETEPKTQKENRKKKWVEAPKQGLEDARKIVDRIFKRQFYRNIGSIKSKTCKEGKIMSEVIHRDGTKQTIKKDLISTIKEEQYGRGDREETPCKNAGETTLSQIISHDDTGKLEKGDLTLSIKKVDYGMGRENPVDKFWFYKKSKPNTPIKIPKEDVSSMLPEVFQELEVLIFCKNDGKARSAKKSFKDWGRKKEKQSNCSQGAETPEKMGRQERKSRNEKAGVKRKSNCSQGAETPQKKRKQERKSREEKAVVKRKSNCSKGAKSPQKTGKQERKKQKKEKQV